MTTKVCEQLLRKIRCGLLNQDFAFYRLYWSGFDRRLAHVAQTVSAPVTVPAATRCWASGPRLRRQLILSVGRPQRMILAVHCVLIVINERAFREIIRCSKFLPVFGCSNRIRRSVPPFDAQNLNRGCGLPVRN